MARGGGSKWNRECDGWPWKPLNEADKFHAVARKGDSGRLSSLSKACAGGNPLVVGRCQNKAWPRWVGLSLFLASGVEDDEKETVPSRKKAGGRTASTRERAVCASRGLMWPSSDPHYAVSYGRLVGRVLVELFHMRRGYNLGLLLHRAKSNMASR